MSGTRIDLAAFLVAGSVAAAPLGAQVCGGFPSLRTRTLQAHVGLTAYSYATGLGASVTAGRTVYGTLGVEWRRDQELVRSMYGFRLEGGADLVLPTQRRVVVCPLAAVALSFQPGSWWGSPYMNYRHLEPSLGLGLAVIATRTRHVAVRPTVHLRAALLAVTRRYDSPDEVLNFSQTLSDVYLEASVGVGLAVKDALTVRPGIRVPLSIEDPEPDRYFVVEPFGREEAEVAFEIVVGISLGRRVRGTP